MGRPSMRRIILSFWNQRQGLGVSFLTLYTSAKHCLTQRVEKLCVIRWNATFVPAGSPSRGGDVGIYVFDINQPSLPTPFYSVLVSISLFMVLSTVFHSINSPDNSPLSHSVLPVLFLPNWSFQLYISLYESLPQPWYNPLWLTGLKAQVTNSFILESIQGCNLCVVWLDRNVHVVFVSDTVQSQLFRT